MSLHPDLAAAIARVKASNPLPDLIGRDLNLQRDGRHLVALCPFHGEKTPSFHVYGDHFHCFGCGAHGDAIGWTMRTQRLAFPAAVAALDGGSPAGRSMPRPIAVKAPSASAWRAGQRVHAGLE